jgi:hypothetical protein
MTDLAIGLTQTAIGEALDAIDSGDFSTDQATLAVYSEGCHTLLTAMSAAGHHARQLHAAIDGFEAAEAAGLGQLGLYSLAQVAKA